MPNGQKPGLEMRGAEVVALSQEMELHGLARHLHALEVVCERGKVLAPEALAAHPFRLVDLGRIELVMPDEFPLLLLREKRLCLTRHRCLPREDDTRLLDLGVDEPRIRSHRREDACNSDSFHKISLKA